MDEKDKVIVILAVGFLVSTTIMATLALTEFGRYGISPNVNLTELRVEDPVFCDGSVSVSYYLVNTGRSGFAEVEILFDEQFVTRNSYYVVRGDSRLVVEPLRLDDCGSHVLSAQVTNVWF